MLKILCFCVCAGSQSAGKFCGNLRGQWSAYNKEGHTGLQPPAKVN